MRLFVFGNVAYRSEIDLYRAKRVTATSADLIDISEDTDRQMSLWRITDSDGIADRLTISWHDAKSALLGGTAKAVNTITIV